MQTTLYDMWFTTVVFTSAIKFVKPRISGFTNNFLFLHWFCVNLTLFDVTVLKLKIRFYHAMVFESSNLAQISKQLF